MTHEHDRPFALDLLLQNLGEQNTGLLRFVLRAHEAMTSACVEGGQRPHAHPTPSKIRVSIRARGGQHDEHVRLLTAYKSIVVVL